MEDQKNNFQRLKIMPFGKIENNQIYVYQLTNKSGMQVNVLNYGGIIESINTADKRGNFGNVVLGYNNIEDYINDPFYIGSIVGRFAGRIAKGEFCIDKKKYHVSIRPDGFHLHGGEKGFNKMIWEATPFETDTTSGITLFYLSKDGEEGFPGNLSVWVTYTLTDDDSLQVSYKATTDVSTVLNLTQHSYFNLSNHSNLPVLNHQLKFNTNIFLPVTEDIIPSGEYAPVTNTPFDFTNYHTIGERIQSNHPQLVSAGGYDHTFVLKKQNSDEEVEAASVIEPTSGRKLTVFTSEPTIHLYTGNFLGRSEEDKDSSKGFLKHSAFCLETQHAGDSPNKSHFPSVLLNPGETFSSRTVYQFSATQDS